MDQILDCLIKLQKSDLDRIALVQDRDDLKTRLVQLEQLLERGHRELAEKQEKLSSAEAFYREKSMELKGEVEKAKDAKAKLNNVTKQKEFLANQKEVEFLKRSNAKKEEEIVNLMEAIEEYKAGIRDNEERIAKLEQECQEEREANAAQIDALEAEIDAVEATRAALSAEVKPGILKKYNRILKAREGQAVVAVVDGGTCAGCHMRIQPQVYQNLLMSKTFDYCPSCQRFVYVSEGTENASDGE